MTRRPSFEIPVDGRGVTRRPSFEIAVDGRGVIALRIPEGTTRPSFNTPSQVWSVTFGRPAREAR